MYKFNISIFIEYSLIDEEVMIDTQHLKDRINHYQQGSKFRLMYNGSCLYSQWFVGAGLGLAVCAIPISEGEQGEGDITVGALHAHICYLISAHTCNVTKDRFDEIMGIERVVIE